MAQRRGISGNPAGPGEDDPLKDLRRRLLERPLILKLTFAFLVVTAIVAGLNQIFDLKAKVFPDDASAIAPSTSRPTIVGPVHGDGTTTGPGPATTAPQRPALVLDRSFDSKNRIDGLVWADGSVWVLSRSRLLRYDPDGLLLASYGIELEVFMTSRVSVGAVNGLAWDGTGFWTVADVLDYGPADASAPPKPPETTRRLYRFTVGDSKGLVDRWVPAPPHKVSPDMHIDVDWDGSALWYVGETAIYRIDVASSPPGDVISQFPVDVAISGIASDGRDLFVVNYGACSATIEKVTPPAEGAGPKPVPSAVYASPSTLRCLKTVSRQDGFLWGAMVNDNYFEQGRVVRLATP